jgi:hypothetical protein
MLAMPTSLCIHNFFHVSLLKKYVLDVNHFLSLECDSGRARRRFFSVNGFHIGRESQEASESSHGFGKVSMEVVWS